MICCSNPRYRVFWLSVLSLLAIVHGFACLLFKENAAYLHRGEAETLLQCWCTLHMSHKVSLCWPHLISFSLSFYPAQTCHLAKTLQSVYLIGSVILRNEILWAAGWRGLSYRDASHSWRTRLLKNQTSKQTFFYHEYAGNLPVLWSCGTKSLGLSSGKNGLLFVCMIWWDFSLISFKKKKSIVLKKKNSGKQRGGS